MPSPVRTHPVTGQKTKIKIAIITKSEETNSTAADSEKPLQFRNNSEVQKAINAYKSDNENDVSYYNWVVKETAERARDMLLYKDMQRYEEEMRLIEKQLPKANEFHGAQSPEVKARIEAPLQDVQPYNKDKAFVDEVLRERNRKNRQILRSPKAGMA